MVQMLLVRGSLQRVEPVGLCLSVQVRWLKVRRGGSNICQELFQPPVPEA